MRSICGLRRSNFCVIGSPMSAIVSSGCYMSLVKIHIAAETLASAI